MHPRGLAGGHIKHYLVVVAKINCGELRVLLPPFRDVGLVALITLKKIVFAEVRKNIGALFRHQHARIFGIGEIDLRKLSE